MTLTVKMDKKRIPAAPQAEQNDRDNALEEDSDHKEDYTESEDSFEKEETSTSRSSDSEEESDGEEDKDRPAKRRKRNLFVETEAEVDEDDDDEEEEDYEQDLDFIDEANEAEALQPQIYRAIDKREEEAFDEEEITKRLKERYGPGAYKSDAYRGDIDRVPVQFLMPTNRDPRLWIIRCKPGRERDIVSNIMRKYLAYFETPHRLNIKSVVFREFLKGYIYVEARSMSDVQAALDKINGVYASRIQMVPLEEMTDVMKVKKKSETLREGAWVRINRGKYKGDLAQVLDISEDSDSIRVRLIPRLDLITGSGKEGKRKAGNAPRPQQRLFNPKDIDKSDKTLSKSKGYWIWGADTFDKNGYLEKEIKRAGLIIENVSPSLEEISKFSLSDTAASDYNGISSALTEVEHKTAAIDVKNRFRPGDNVCIIEGELINARGVVKSVGRALITLTMNDNFLGEIQIEPAKIEHIFTVGDQIKVIRGKFAGELGMIVNVGDKVVTVFSDKTKKQFVVLSKDIQGSMALQPIKPSTTKIEEAYKLLDIVFFNDRIGVIINVEEEKYSILDVNGTIQSISAAQIAQKRNPRQTTAEIDAYGQSLHTGDLAEVLAGTSERKQGTVLYLYRGAAFLHNKDIAENSGVFVTKTRLLSNIGATGSRSANNGVKNNILPSSSSKDRAFLAGRKTDPFINQTVIITGGPFKGYQGIVKSFTEKGYRIELHTNAKMITVNQGQLVLQGQNGRGREERLFSRAAAGAQTPLVGAKTPNVISGAQTPRTYDGSRTPAWDAGARTPAWDAGARTPRFNNLRDMPSRATGFSEKLQQLDAIKAVGILGNNWLILGIEVLLVSGEFKGAKGVIKSTDGKSASVVLDDFKKEMKVSSEQLEPVPPSKKDRCVFLVGDDKGEVGTLIGMDGEDAIVKLDADAEFKVAALGKICKIRQS